MTNTRHSHIECVATTLASIFFAVPSLAAAELPPPSNLTVPETDTDGRITVSWDEVPGATYYRLERRLDGGSWSPREDSAQTTREDPGLTYGMWEYRAQACDRMTCGTWSGPIAVFVTVISPLPDKPTGVFGPNVVKSFEDIPLTWYPSTGASSYVLEERIDSHDDREVEIGNWNQIYSDAATRFVVENKNNNSRFSYRVNACNSDMVCSNWSQEKSITVVFAEPKAHPSKDDVEIAEAWSAFRSALDAGDVSSAMQYVIPSKHSKYEPAFLSLGPEIKSLSANWSDIKEVKIYDYFAEYALVETVDGVERLHLIVFQKDGETWKLAEF